MRHNPLLAFLALSTTSLFCAAASHAAEPADEATFGTTPAGSAKAALQPSAEPGGFGQFAHERGGGTAPLATDPPTDWAVLHAGLRPHLGTFGGLATFALAHERTERFYGVLSLSGVRNDAGTHVGLAQIALGRNLSDTFIGGAQLSLTENRARTFVGLGQLSLAYNRSLSMTGLGQAAAYNRARSFAGLAQVGAYNRADESWLGVAQVGAFNHARGSYAGIVRLGVLNATGPELFADGGSDSHRFAGVAEIGLVNTVDGNFYGVGQLGVMSHVGGDFVGVAQIGVLGAGAERFHGLAQIGALAISKRSVGAQIGAAAVAIDEHTGMQLGALGNYARSIDGAQIGLVNLGDHVRGLQIGLFNHARHLRGVQIGLANHAEDGVLPWTALLNMGFGDGDGGDTGEDEERGAARITGQGARL